MTLWLGLELLWGFESWVEDSRDSSWTLFKGLLRGFESRFVDLRNDSWTLVKVLTWGFGESLVVSIMRSWSKYFVCGIWLRTWARFVIFALGVSFLPCEYGGITLTVLLLMRLVSWETYYPFPESYIFDVIGKFDHVTRRCTLGYSGPRKMWFHCLWQIRALFCKIWSRETEVSKDCGIIWLCLSSWRSPTFVLWKAEVS